jgi:hypothetical protein
MALRITDTFPRFFRIYLCACGPDPEGARRDRRNDDSEIDNELDGNHLDVPGGASHDPK